VVECVGGVCVFVVDINPIQCGDIPIIDIGVANSVVGILGHDTENGFRLATGRHLRALATFSRGEDGDGVALIDVSVKKSAVLTLFAGEQDKNSPINWSKKIAFIRTSSPSCSTRLGVRPGSLVAEAEKRYGRVFKIVKSEIESREFARFKNQPKGLIFQLDYSGVFKDGQYETVSYRPEAKILSIAIEAR
jgi:hypothetical protein